MGDLRVVELELGRVEQREAFGVSLHHPVLDTVVNHLDIMAGARRPEMAPAGAVLLGGRRREHVEDRRQPVDRLVGAADHHAVAHVYAPHPTRRADVDVVEAFRRKRLGACLVVGPAAVAAVDDHVPFLQQLGELVDRLLGGIARGHHDPDVARRLELRNEVLQAVGAGGAHPLRGRDCLGAEVERHHLVVGVALDPVDHVAAHAAEPYKADLHH